MKYSLIKRFSYTLIVFALLAIIPNLSYGQWILGLKAGYNSTKLTGADVYGGMNYKGGIEAGMVISKKLKVDFAFESGIFFSQAGVNQKFNLDYKETAIDQVTGNRVTVDSFFSYDNTLTLNYLKVPLMLRKSFSIKGSNLYPYRRKISITDIDIMFGPYVSYLLSASASYNTQVTVKRLENDIIQSTEPAKTLTDAYHQTFKIGQDTTNMIVSTDPSTVPVGSYLNPYLPPRATMNDGGLSKIDIGVVAALGLSVELSADSKLTFGGNYSMGLMTIDKEYFSNLQYTVSPGGTVDVGIGTPVSISKEVKTKMDLKNTGFGFYIGYVRYLK